MHPNNFVAVFTLVDLQSPASWMFIILGISDTGFATLVCPGVIAVAGSDGSAADGRGPGADVESNMGTAAGILGGVSASPGKPDEGSSIVGDFVNASPSGIEDGIAGGIRRE